MDAVADENSLPVPSARFLRVCRLNSPLRQESRVRGGNMRESEGPAREDLPGPAQAVCGNLSAGACRLGDVRLARLARAAMVCLSGAMTVVAAVIVITGGRLPL